jgi:hypothetical protein
MIASDVGELVARWVSKGPGGDPVGISCGLLPTLARCPGQSPMHVPAHRRPVRHARGGVAPVAAVYRPQLGFKPGFSSLEPPPDGGSIEAPAGPGCPPAPCARTPGSRPPGRPRRTATARRGRTGQRPHRVPPRQTTETRRQHSASRRDDRGSPILIVHPVIRSGQAGAAYLKESSSGTEQGGRLPSGCPSRDRLPLVSAILEAAGDAARCSCWAGWLRSACGRRLCCVPHTPIRHG